MSTVPVVARIRVKDGRCFDLHSNWTASRDGIAPGFDVFGNPEHDSCLFYWTEGNQCCDCNRHEQINALYGEALDTTCGDHSTLVFLMYDGKVVYKEQK